MFYLGEYDQITLANQNYEGMGGGYKYNLIILHYNHRPLA